VTVAALAQRLRRWRLPVFVTAAVIDLLSPLPNAVRPILLFMTLTVMWWIPGLEALWRNAQAGYRGDDPSNTETAV
jgi:hypothetical protein